MTDIADHREAEAVARRHLISHFPTDVACPRCNLSRAYLELREQGHFGFVSLMVPITPLRDRIESLLHPEDEAKL